MKLYKHIITFYSDCPNKAVGETTDGCYIFAEPVMFIEDIIEEENFEKVNP